MSEGTVDMNTRACPRCGGLVVHAKDCETETVKALRQQLAEGIAEGRLLERAAIVADLKEWCSQFGITVQDRMLLMAAASRYERGEHEEGK